jgi:putative transposase
MGQNLLPVVTKNSVGIVAIEVLGQWNYVRAVMRELIFSLLYSLSCGLQTRARLHLEIVALRHQLAVLRRKVPTRPKLKSADRWLWIVLSRLWSEWRSGLVLVKPETVVAWQRKGFRLYWTWKSRHRGGRPKSNTQVREIIQKMSRENPL